PHCAVVALLSPTPPPPRSPLFPYTTLFRSQSRHLRRHEGVVGLHQAHFGEWVVGVGIEAGGYEHPVRPELPQCRDHQFREGLPIDRKSTRLNSSHVKISYAVFCLKKKKQKE